MISAFMYFLTAIDRVLFLEQKLGISLCLHPDSRYQHLNVIKFENIMTKIVVATPSKGLNIFMVFPEAFCNFIEHAI